MTQRDGALPVVVAVLAAVGVATAGGLATEIGPWYLGLRQPPWKPPDWAFGPAWTVIFGLTATAGVIGWRRLGARRDRQWMLRLFAVNAALNIAWSVLFFHIQRPDWALLEVGPLWLSILALVLFLRRAGPLASRLLWPYLVWVAYAATINFATVQHNGPFGAP